MRSPESEASFTLRLVLRPDWQAVNLDEAFGGGVVELVLAVVGGQTILVEGPRRLPAYHSAGPFVQPHADVAGNEALCALHVGVEISPVCGIPEAVVNDVRIFLRDAGLGPGLLFG